ncbi:Hydroquinone glucosyltransferase [Linum grandiflorum]
MEDVVAAAAASNEANLRVVMLPCPGRGHLIPFVELSKRLLLRHNFSITILIPDNGSGMTPQRQFLQSLDLPPTISPLYLPPISLADVPSDSNPITRVSVTVIRSLPAIRDALIHLQHGGPVVAAVTDFVTTDALQVAAQLKIPPYVFYTCSGFHLTLGLKAPEEFLDSTEPLKLPGCVPLSGPDFPAPYLDKKKDEYKWMIHVHERISSDAAGIMINSFMELESEIFKALTEERSCPAVYSIGPIMRLESEEDSAKLSNESIECLKWLDKQPESSVLFISFGSGPGAKQSKAQSDELAHGLAMSGKRFIWVIKPPGNDVVPSSFLPEGFLDTTKGVGLVILDWAPQIQILSHGSTGGFMSHCGWNSTLETITYGVPVLAWPNHADQRMNAVFLSKDAKVGKLMRRKVKELKAAANAAIGNDGSSTKSLDEVANLWKKKQIP